MKDTFIKKYWDEEDIMYYIHFEGDWAVRQLEISKDGRKHVTEDSLDICDQKLAVLEIEEADFITKEEFEKAWEQ